MLVADVQQAIHLLEAGEGPVEITVTLARDLAAQHPDFLDGRLKLLRFASLGSGPYAPEAYARYELVIRPDPDPVSRDEQKARSRFDKQLAAATEREAVAAAAFEVAERVYLDLYGHQLALGEAWGVSHLGRLIQNPRDMHVTQAERDELKAKVAEAQVVWSEAGDSLQRARGKLNALVRRADNAARLVRLTRS